MALRCQSRVRVAAAIVGTVIELSPCVRMERSASHVFLSVGHGRCANAVAHDRTLPSAINAAYSTEIPSVDGIYNFLGRRNETTGKCFSAFNADKFEAENIHWWLNCMTYFSKSASHFFNDSGRFSSRPKLFVEVM